MGGLVLHKLHEFSACGTLGRCKGKSKLYSHISPFILPCPRHSHKSGAGRGLSQCITLYALKASGILAAPPVRLHPRAAAAATDQPAPGILTHCSCQLALAV